MKPEQERWHLDKRVPIALIVTILIQTGAALWWAATVNARVDVLERQATATAPQDARLTRLEVKLEFMQEGIARIERALSPRR